AALAGATTTQPPDAGPFGIHASGAPLATSYAGRPGLGQAAVAAATRALGVPYVWGGASPEAGFDCSGLVQWAYRQVGVDLPRTTAVEGWRNAPGSSVSKNTRSSSATAAAPAVSPVASQARSRSR